MDSFRSQKRRDSNSSSDRLAHWGLAHFGLTRAGLALVGLALCGRADACALRRRRCLPATRACPDDDIAA
jgi:hypothetical protein